MKEFFLVDTEDKRKSLLNQARKIALSALQEYDLEWKHIHFNQLSDTITFKIETESEGGFLLRIHSNRMTKEEIQSEIMWLNALSKCDGFTVPEGWASRSGTYVLEIEADQGVRLCVTLMRWLEGNHYNGSFTERQVMNMGVLMARLHVASTTYVPASDFTRPIWGTESFRSNMAELELFYERFLSQAAWSSYQAAAEKIIHELSSMQIIDYNYGIIHADLHLDNLIFNGDNPSPIDFGRCGYGYHLYDIAGTILGLYPNQRQQFIQGYESVRKLEPDYIRNLTCFFVMFMIENYCHHAPDSRETVGLIEEQPYAQAIIRDYLNDTPFLFNSIEPVKI